MSLSFQQAVEIVTQALGSYVDVPHNLSARLAELEISSTVFAARLQSLIIQAGYVPPPDLDAVVARPSSTVGDVVTAVTDSTGPR